MLRGDYRRQHILELAGVSRARMLTIADDDTATARATVAVARTLNPDLRVVIRTRNIDDVHSLTVSGADIVIAEEMEGVVRLFSEVMLEYDVPAEQIDTQESMVRSASYAALLDLPKDGRPLASLCPVKYVPTMSESVCSHLDQIRPVVPRSKVCEECVKLGDKWVHLRMCLTCGKVGCCNSSKNKHASGHYEMTKHPLMKSLEPGENWAWCYADETYI